MKGFGVTAFALLASAAFGLGQTTTMPGSGTRQRPDSIAPGTVNYVEGEVMLDGQALQTHALQAQARAALQPNDTLSTQNGYAEVLLTPGTFLRLGHNSEIRLLSAGLADARAQLDKGTAIVEVDQFIKGTNLAVLEDSTTVQIEKNGLYDFNADQPAVRVLDGKVNVEEPGGSKTIGKNDQLLLTSATPLKKVDFDSKSVKAEPLYVWSEARSQSESQANVAVAQRLGAYGGWAGPGWYWDPYWSFYSYLPASGYVYSPFGWGFYSPAFTGYYGVPYRGYYGRVGYGYRAYTGYRAGVGLSAHVQAFHGSGFGGGGFHGGGFHGGGGHR